MRERREPLFQGRPAPGLAPTLVARTPWPEAPRSRRRGKGRCRRGGDASGGGRTPRRRGGRRSRGGWLSSGDPPRYRHSGCSHIACSGLRKDRSTSSGPVRSADRRCDLPDDGHLQSRAPGHARCRRERHGRCPILGISHVSRRGPQGPASAARDDRPSLGALIERPFPNEED